MPIFEYTCHDCRTTFEELVFAQDMLPPCPKCESTNVTKLMSACAIQKEGCNDAPDFGAMPPMGRSGCGSGGG